MKKIIVDVGATGFPAAISYPDGFKLNNKEESKADSTLEVYLFEPNLDFYNKLIEQFGELSNFHLYQLALSNKKGTFDFYLTDKQDCSSLRPPKEESWVNRPDVTNYQITQVKVDLMKNVLSDLPYISYLKLDTQGSEYEILEGMGDLLDKTHYIRCETSTYGMYVGERTYKEVISLMESKGFIYLKEENIGPDIFFINPNFK
jgi:FkbM family methyltransferase